MVTIKNVAIVGGTGNLGKSVLDALVNSGKFNITAVTRESSQASFPASVKVARANYESVESVTAAFQGQDAVVSIVAMEALGIQNILIDAAAAAGVKRFVPSEFGSTTGLPITAALPVFKGKVATRKYLEDKVAKTPGLTYSYIVNGPFFDWGVQGGFLLEWREGTPKIYGSGDQLFSGTTLPSISQAVVGVLSHYEETKNRDVYVHDVVTSQNHLLEVAKKILPEKQWKPTTIDLTTLEAYTDQLLANGDKNPFTIYNYAALAIFGDGYGGHFESTDNELLGVSVKTEAELEALLRAIIGGGK